MKLKSLLIALAAVCLAIPARAQYGQIANQIPQLIQPALSGSLNYKGFVEAGYTAGLGNKRADILDFSTVQGFRYSNWFFMGVGAGVDVMFSHSNTPDYSDYPEYDNYWNHSNTTTACMIPLFSDFRFNIGGTTGVSFFADVRIGVSLLLGNKYVAVGDGYVTNREFFYLKPSLGLRIPLSSTNSRQAMNIGITYQFLTTDYWYLGANNTSLNSLGANISFEW